MEGKTRGRHKLPVYRLLAPLSFRDTKGNTYVVPRGWETDFVSANKFFRWLLPDMKRASCLHDMLCQNLNFPKAEADRIFREAMAADGVFLTIRWAAWAYVRMRGIRNQWPQPFTPITDTIGRVVGWEECQLPA